MSDPIVIGDGPIDYAVLFPDHHGRGLELEHRPRSSGYASVVADPFPASMLIPRSEWQARIEEMEVTKTRLSDLIDRSGIPCKDQSQTNFCWGNSPVYCMEELRVVQGQTPVVFSPASVCAPIVQYRNDGGFGDWALKYISEHGIYPVHLWPANAISRAYKSDAADAVARKYRAVEWWEFEPRNLDQVVSALLRRIPVSAGYNWWRHQVSLVDVLWRDGTVAILHRNSWGMGWGDRGYGILEGSRMYPDDACAPRVALAS